MGNRFEVASHLPPFVEDIVRALEKHRYILKIEEADFHATAKAVLESLPVPELPPVSPGYLRIEPEDNTPCNAGVERFLSNHQPIENNFETIAKENLGICEDRKDWLKPLKAAVKEYGHDQILESFYEWSLAQGNFIGRKPVTMFLKNIESNIGAARRKPLVTNPVLTKLEERVAYISDNRVFFTGDYRVRLATLLKDYGPEVVIEAFETFFQDVEDKSINWAARDFLQRASVMITIIQRKKAEAEAQAQLQAAALAAAKEAVEEAAEEDDEEL